MILIEIKKADADYLKKNSQTPPGKKTAKNKTDQMHMAFGPITSCFSVERDFTYLSVDSEEENNVEDSFLICHPGSSCITISPPVLQSLLDSEHHMPDEELEPPVRRSSGSYLFRSRRSFGEDEPRIQPRSGMYLLRTRKSIYSPRSTRGNYLFRTRKSMDRFSRYVKISSVFR